MSGPGRRRSWRSVSLRTLLLLMLVCGCALGLIGRESRQAARRAEIAQELSKATSKIEVEYVNLFGLTTNERPPEWQAKILGEQFFQHITGVVVADPGALPQDGRLLGELRHLRTLELTDLAYSTPTLTFVAAPVNRATFTDRHAAGLRNLRNLESVLLSGAGITDDGLSYLSPKNPLKTLDLSYTSVGDAGAAHLARFTSLETLDLSHTWITDAGLRRLATLPKLKSLTLRRVMVSDAGLKELARCESLQSLVLNDLAITPAGVGELARLPRLRRLDAVGIKLSQAEVLSLKLHTASGRREPADGRPGKDELRDTARRVHGDLQVYELAIAMGKPDVFWAIDQPCPPNGLRYLKWLLEHGADPNESRFSDSRLVHPDAKRIFLQSGDAEGTPIVGGAAPVIVLASTNSLAEVQVLLEYGADPNRVDGSGRTALTVAAGCGHREMIELLLKHGAAFHVPEAQSPLCSAAACGQIEALKFLVARGADVNRPNHHGNPPLHISLRNPESFNTLLELGADVGAANAHGQTPLHLAAEMQDVELMARLLTLGADPGRKNAAGETPIAIAARLGPKAIVELLRSTPSTPAKR